MRHILLLSALLFIKANSVFADVPPVVHSKIGTTISSPDKSVTVSLIHKLQQYNWSDKATLDKDIFSPKSVNIHPSGKKFYVNSLEGGMTVVYEMNTWKKLHVIHHNFTSEHAGLWAKPSGLFHFTHYSADKRNLNEFMGKPVESCFSHGGRYLWVPYYRRSYDINAQDPSALAVIDTERDTIIKLMETGPLPKMIACSHDSRHIAVSHWGDNTIGLINIASDNPNDWSYEKLYIVDYQLKLNYSLSESVNRDVNSGYTLRGTVFTPDDRYLLVGCMGGGGGIAVVDMEKQQYLGRVLGMMPNIRHLIIKDGWLYMSVNAAGMVQRIRLDKFLEAASSLGNDANGGGNRTARADGFEEAKVFAGARTIESSPSGRFIFAACNAGSKLCVVDTETMQMILSTEVDSYPVGLDISKDGTIVITTSQGRDHNGGNAVNIFRVEYSQQEQLPESERALEKDSVELARGEADSHNLIKQITAEDMLLIAAALAVVIGIIWFFARRKRK